MLSMVEATIAVVTVRELIFATVIIRLVIVIRQDIVVHLILAADISAQHILQDLCNPA